MQREYRVVVMIGDLRTKKQFARIMTTTNEDDLDELVQKITDEVERYEAEGEGDNEDSSADKFY